MKLLKVVRLFNPFASFTLKKGGKDIQNAETLLSEMIFCLNFM
jgi:hypothetical protein